MDEERPIIEYSRLPSPPRAPRTKKPLMVRVGWLFILGPLLVALFVGLLMTLSNIIAPGARYQFGDTTITPIRTNGLGMEWFRLLVIVLLILLFSIMLRFGLRSARKFRDE